MTTITMDHFDALNYVKKSRELGVSEQVAEYQARQFEQLEQTLKTAVSAIKADIDNKELATKGDMSVLHQDVIAVRQDLEKAIEILRKEIAIANNKLIIWVGGFILASGLIQHFFK